MDIDRYLDRITGQHRNKTRFLSHMTALLSQLDAAHTVAKEMASASFSIENASGKQLDALGVLVGANRVIPDSIIPTNNVVLDDDTYRKLIQFKTLCNQWDGTIKKLAEMMPMFEEMGIYASFWDWQSMEMRITVSGYITDTIRALLLSGQILPKPMGVSGTVSITAQAQAQEWHMTAVTGTQIIFGGVTAWDGTE